MLGSMIMLSKFSNFPDELSENDELRVRIKRVWLYIVCDGNPDCRHLWNSDQKTHPYCISNLRFGTRVLMQ